MKSASIKFLSLSAIALAAAACSTGANAAPSSQSGLYDYGDGNTTDIAQAYGTTTATSRSQVEQQAVASAHGGDAYGESPTAVFGANTSRASQAMASSGRGGSMNQ